MEALGPLPKRRYVDLHLHTNHSDGADDPERVIQRAAGLDLAAVAITDHDTTSGLTLGRQAAEAHGIEFLDGTEISAYFGKTEVHVLGLGIQPENEVLQQGLRELVQGRSERADKMINRLNTLGIPVERGAIEARTAQGAIGRMHIAKEIRELGHARSVQDAFDKYIKAGRPAYVPKMRLACLEAIELIHQAQGLAFIAHPGLGDVQQALPKLLALPFDGIEVYHTRHSPGHLDQLTQLAQENYLLITGGSDCHGEIKDQPPLMGQTRVPYEHFQRIEAALAAGKGSANPDQA